MIAAINHSVAGIDNFAPYFENVGFNNPSLETK